MNFDRDQKSDCNWLFGHLFLSLIDGQTEIYTDTKIYITQTLVICVRKKESMKHTLKETLLIQVKEGARNILQQTKCIVVLF